MYSGGFGQGSIRIVLVPNLTDEGSRPIIPDISHPITNIPVKDGCHPFDSPSVL